MLLDIITKGDHRGNMTGLVKLWHLTAGLVTEVSSVATMCASVFHGCNEIVPIWTKAPPSPSTPPRWSLERRSRSLFALIQQNLDQKKRKKKWLKSYIENFFFNLKKVFLKLLFKNSTVQNILKKKKKLCVNFSLLYKIGSSPEPCVVFRVSVSPNCPLIEAGEVYLALNTLVGPISSLQWRMASSRARTYALNGPLRWCISKKTATTTRKKKNGQIGQIRHNLL